MMMMMMILQTYSSRVHKACMHALRTVR